MKRRLFTSGLLGAGLLSGVALTGFAKSAAAQSIGTEPAAKGGLAKLTVFRSPTCGCCEDWTSHVRAEGFEVEERVTEEMDAVKASYGVPEQISSCHTAVVDGYFIEGHVPAADIKRLLSERPAIAGIAVPGMPMGSPGMEQGGQVDPYLVVALGNAGELSIFADYR